MKETIINQILKDAYMELARAWRYINDYEKPPKHALEELNTLIVDDMELRYKPFGVEVFINGRYQRALSSIAVGESHIKILYDDHIEKAERIIKAMRKRAQQIWQSVGKTMPYHVIEWDADAESCLDAEITVRLLASQAD